MINYPNKKGPYISQTMDATNRGMDFERLIDESNTFYRLNQQAVIHKKPTPVQIVKVDYPKRQLAKIVEAYYKVPSTTDYNGIYRGYYIDFDVKESHSATSFPLKNIHAHQIDHLEAVNKHGGLAFILIYFKTHGTVHLLPYKVLAQFVKRAEKGRKSMTYEELVTQALPVKIGYRPSIDYLVAVDRLIDDC
ncbi:MAG: Holliday junction resolvase RecU [Acholeplasmatales bacterium]|nr:MAG: Holliday junction resolvase RecU [Acholeplasmatales bacterium]